MWSRSIGKPISTMDVFLLLVAAFLLPKKRAQSSVSRGDPACTVLLGEMSSRLLHAPLLPARSSCCYSITLDGILVFSYKADIVHLCRLWRQPWQRRSGHPFWCLTMSSSLQSSNRPWALAPTWLPSLARTLIQEAGLSCHSCSPSGCLAGASPLSMR